MGSLETDGVGLSNSPAFKSTDGVGISTPPTFKTGGVGISISSTFINAITNPDVIPLAQFVSDPSDRCAVCQSILWNAYQLPCGHHICQTDIDTIFREKDTDNCCVQDCKITFSKNEVFPDACKRREMSNLTVYCSYKELGCPVQLPWRSLSKHEASCNYQGKKCDKCGQAVLQSEIETHMSSICEYRETTCDYCSERIRMKDMEDHQKEECRRCPLSCPNECGVQDILREQMDTHLNQCPHKKVVCPFSNHGCTFEGTKEQMAAHQAELLSAHLDMLVNGLNISQQQNESLFAELKVTLDNVVRDNARIPQLVEEKKKLQKETQTNKISIQEMKKFLASNGERVIQTGRKLEDKASVETVDKLKHEVTAMKDAVQATNLKMSNIERAGVIAGSSGGGNPKVIEQVEKQVGLLDIRLNELDLRLQLQETINHDGVLMWKIRDYSRRKREAVSGKTLSLYSQPFYTSKYGYKLCGRTYLNGDGSGKGAYLSMFLVVMRGDFDALLPWPFQLPITMKVLDQNGTNQHVIEQFMPNAKSNSFQKPKTEMNVACGVPCFVLHSKLETETYLKDDTIFLRVVVDCSNAQTLY